MPAAIMNAIGSSTVGSLVHMHPGNECQKNAFVAMQYPQEQTDRCINVNLYSVLRCFYQNKAAYREKNIETEESGEGKAEVEDKLCTEGESKEDDAEPSAKKARLDEGASQKKQWEMENERACRVLEGKVDSLVVTAKEHPVNIVKELMQFLKGGRSFVVFGLLKEPLQDLYGYLKSRVDVISIRVSNSFMRNYQVLPNRTHPEVNMSTGGYVLTGFKLRC